MKFPMKCQLKKDFPKVAKISIYRNKTPDDLWYIAFYYRKNGTPIWYYSVDRTLKGLRESIDFALACPKWTTGMKFSRHSFGKPYIKHLKSEPMDQLAVLRIKAQEIKELCIIIHGKDYKWHGEVPQEEEEKISDSLFHHPIEKNLTISFIVPPRRK